ncbi:MAG: putative 7-carboxy-7-deazaguanine synthase QueE [Ruminococcus sp.]|nr:putative 7-carboxy-7-deazaguanine synthase QueE [Ruminococcus sp.]
MSTFSLAESFVSINGEGQFAGKLALFLRFTGCNLRCSWCDTMWANAKDAPHTLCSTQHLLDTAKRAKEDHGICHVTLTGGEPLLQEGLPELCDGLDSLGLMTEIETNGAVPLAPFLEKCSSSPCITMDYKLPASGMEDRMCLENFPLLREKDTLKFVCATQEDLDRAAQIISKYKPVCAVFLSPVFGSIEPADMVEFMKKNRLGRARLQLQLHKLIWSPDKRGV